MGALKLHTEQNYTGLKVVYGGLYEGKKSVQRFLNVDPLASKMPSWSPYSAMYDNPIRYTDPTGAEPEDWIKNIKTGQYEWRNEVTSVANTPKGYTYIGKEDKSILKDLGWNITYPASSSTKVGTIASDAENEGPLNYSASHIVKAKVETNLRINAAVSVNLGLKDGEEFSKKFLGVSVDVVNVSRNTGSDEITTTGDVSFSFKGSNYSTALKPDNARDRLKEVGTNIALGNILIPASQLSKGDAFPAVKVTGNWWNVKDDRSGGTPLVFPGTFFPLKYTNKFLPYIPDLYVK